jgi:hypothetical protein
MALKSFLSVRDIVNSRFHRNKTTSFLFKNKNKEKYLLAERESVCRFRLACLVVVDVDSFLYDFLIFSRFFFGMKTEGIGG